jgi:hypothetical protein
MTYVSPEDREDLYIVPPILRVFAYRDNVLLSVHIYEDGHFEEDIDNFYEPVEYDTLNEKELHWANKALNYFQSL